MIISGQFHESGHMYSFTCTYIFITFIMMYSITNLLYILLVLNKRIQMIKVVVTLKKRISYS
jgi:hypothetical protein